MWLAVLHHMAITALYVVPSNPVQQRAAGYIHRYMYPFFWQSWQLFAPDVSGQSRYILARCRVKERDGKTSVVGPFDATTRFEETHQRYRIGPAQRVLRSLLTPLDLLGAPLDPFLMAIARNPTGHTDPEMRALVDRLDRLSRVRSDLALQLLGRVASVECRRHYPDSSIREVQAWAMFVSPPEFSRRFEGDQGGIFVKVTHEWRRHEGFARLKGFE